MAFTYGFYNSFNHDRVYDAIQLSSIFDGIILDGVYATYGEAFIVRTTGAANQVSVGAGRAWFYHTWNLNDATMLMAAPASDPYGTRIDALVIDVNSSEKYRENSLMWVKGSAVASGSPAKPTLINTVYRKQYPLCYITRKPNVEVINQEDIENRVGSSECPFVTGVLETIDIDLLLLQWKDQWSQFVLRYQQLAIEHMETNNKKLDDYLAELKRQIEEFKSATVADVNKKMGETDARIEETNKKITILETYYLSVKAKLEGMEADFLEWLDHIKDVFKDDPAGGLQMEFEELADLVVRTFYGTENSVTTIDYETDVIVTENESATVTTKFTKEGDVDVITTEVDPKVSSKWKYTKRTTIDEKDGKDVITTTVTQTRKV